MLKKALSMFLVTLSCFLILEMLGKIIEARVGDITWTGMASQYGVTWKGIAIDAAGRLQTGTGKVSISTGTVLHLNANYISTYTIQNPAGAAEVFICAPNNNTVDVRYTFYSDGKSIVNRGLELVETGQTLILNTWDGSIYFQPESGTADVSIQEVYE